MKKLLNWQSSFSSTDISWKEKTPIISMEKVKMVANLSKTFLQTQSFLIVSNQKQMIFVLGRPWSREKKLLIFKSSSKTFTQNTKARTNYIYVLYSLVTSFHSSLDTNLLERRATFGLQWICRVQLFIQTTRVHCCLPLNYVTSLLAYCRG